MRNKVLYILLFFAVALFGLTLLAFGQVPLHEELRVIRDVGLVGIELFGVLIAIFVGVNLVYKELDRKDRLRADPEADPSLGVRARQVRRHAADAGGADGDHGGDRCSPC